MKVWCRTATFNQSLTITLPHLQILIRGEDEDEVILGVELPLEAFFLEAGERHEVGQLRLSSNNSDQYCSIARSHMMMKVIGAFENLHVHII